MTTAPAQAAETLLQQIQAYWNEHVHDLEVAAEPVGSEGFFRQLDEYRFQKLHYLLRLVDSAAYQGKELLEIGCGAGIDLVHFARAGARVTGVDLSEVAIDLACQNPASRRLPVDLLVMNGEALGFPDSSFDVVYGHGVLQYAADPTQMIREIHRVLRPGGEAVLAVYHKYSWLNALSKLAKVELEHEDAPVLRKYSVGEFRGLLDPFERVHVVPERFPVKTRLHRGWKAWLYNGPLVSGFNLLPKRLVRPFGWHLMAFATKAA